MRLVKRVVVGPTGFLWWGMGRVERSGTEVLAHRHGATTDGGAKAPAEPPWADKRFAPNLYPNNAKG